MSASTITEFQELITNINLYHVRLIIRFSLVALGAIVFIKWLTRFVRERRLYSQIPGIPSTKVLGNLLGHLEYFWACRTQLPITVFFGDIMLGLTKIFHQMNTGLFYFRIGPFRNIVVVIKARTSEVILSSTKNIIKSAEYDFLKPWLGQGLLLGQGKHWRTHRKLLTPTFHFDILEKFLPVMNTKVNIMVDLISKSYNKKTGVIHIPDVRPYITNSVVDIICETAMGIKMSGQEEWYAEQKGETLLDVTPGSRYALSVRTFLEIVLKRLVSPWMYNDFIFKMTPTGRKMKECLKHAHGFTNNVIRARKAELEEKFNSTESVDEMFKTMSKSKRVVFLDLLLEYHFRDPKEMDLVSIREEVDTFMFGGHDTTSTTLHFAFLLIGINIAKQRKIQEELDDIFAGEEREITLDDTKKMTYLDMAIRETMRLYPPAAFFARNVVEEFEMDGYKIPIGTTLLVLSYGVHRDPELYDQPESYIPERFEPNSKLSKNPFGYIPFSAGSRNCIGQRFAMLELKIVLATVLRKYNLRTITKQEDVEVDISIITKSNTPIEVEFTERENIA